MYTKFMAKQKKAKIYEYTAILEPDNRVGGYTVTIPALPGCISEGDTFEEALKNIEEAAALYLEVMKKHSREIAIENSRPVLAPIRVYAKV